MVSTMPNLLKAASLKPTPTVKRVGRSYIPRPGEGVRHLHCSGPAVGVIRRSHPFYKLLQHQYIDLLLIIRGINLPSHHQVLYTQSPQLHIEKYVDEWVCRWMYKRVVELYIHLFYEVECLPWVRVKLTLRTQQGRRLTVFRGLIGKWV